MNFDELKNKASEVLGTMAGAATRAAGAAKTSVNVCAEEDKIRTAYQNLGKLYYRDSKLRRQTWCLPDPDLLQELREILGESNVVLK